MAVPSASAELMPAVPSYLGAALRRLRANEPPALMAGVQADGRRALFQGSGVHEVQRYLVGNRTRDIFPTAVVHFPSTGGRLLRAPAEVEAQQQFLGRCDAALRVEKAFGEQRWYDVCEAAADGSGEGALLRVAMVSMDNMWNVQNVGLFEDVEDGTVVGKVHCIGSVSSLFTFVPRKEVLPGVPRLEMQAAHSNGLGGYKLCVADVDQHVGSVEVERHYFDFRVNQCTREEAILWLCVLIAAELETKKPLVKFYTTE